MSLIAVLALVAVAIWIVDRILLWCELRGWMTYRLTPRVRHGWGGAVLGLDALLQPERRHVIELKRDGEVYREEDDEAARARSRLASDNGDSPGER